ncbi:hypothetical protein THIOM_005766 [Candidatus Thiomargarita nelsonii]|uniref:Uncharacterized protein n=1 Tax=Candidatus Thiomargarita nelsonii TaxID=1003181 RepID=A0A176RSD3_9GAMM|nr:hypothetical protein THIOM_005766 [Candidatus Thiomargarita nelsonii]
MDNEDNNEKTYWHNILGRLFEFLLTPVKINVSTDVKVVKKLPEADIILLRTDSENWTKEQRERLPDGIRDSKTKYVLIEFKATESLNKNTFIQTSWYEYSYKRSQKISDDEIQTFVMCAKQPQKANREQHGYTVQVQPGIYQSTNTAYNHITLISLNELRNELHNAWVTCLASKKSKKIKAFKLLKEKGFKQIQRPFQEFMAELWRLISTKGDDDMTLELSREDIKAIGKFWGTSLFTQEELDEVLSNTSLEVRLKGLKPEERLMGLKPEERLIGLKPEERLMGLKLEEIEAYLKRRKQQS